MNAKSVMCILCYILAIYGLIILIRKIMSRSEKNKEKSWSYYVEPYAFEKCNKCGLFSCDKACSKSYCGLSQKDIKNKFTSSMESTLLTCPAYIQDCKDYYSSKGQSFPQNVKLGCLTPNMREAML